MQLTPEWVAQRLAAMPAAERYLVAFSGGRDSTVLLHLLWRLREAGRLPALAAVHVHHGLHPEADQWAAAAEAACRAWAIPCEVVRVRVAGSGGLEAAARRARYAAFRQRLGPGEGLLLAHHRDDQAETLLLRLLRGAGPRGLAAMPAWRPLADGWLGRPLLEADRAALADYAAAHGLRWVQDPGNRDPARDRNHLRHEVMPRLAARWPAAAEMLARAARHQQEASRLLDDLARMDLGPPPAPGEPLPLPVLERTPPHRRANLLRYWLQAVCGLVPPDGRHLARVLGELPAARPDAVPAVEWPGGWVRRYRGGLWAGAPLPRHDPAQVVPWDLAAPLVLPGAGWRLVPRRARGQGLSATAVAGGVEVAFRRGGERCRPAGRGHRHALKKLLQEWGVPPWLRDRLPLIRVDGELAQVGSHCLCEPFAAAPGEEGVVVELVPLTAGD